MVDIDRLRALHTYLYNVGDTVLIKKQLTSYVGSTYILNTVLTLALFANVTFSTNALVPC